MSEVELTGLKPVISRHDFEEFFRQHGIDPSGADMRPIADLYWHLDRQDGNVGDGYLDLARIPLNEFRKVSAGCNWLNWDFKGLWDSKGRCPRYPDTTEWRFIRSALVYYRENLRELIAVSDDKGGLTAQTVSHDKIVYQLTNFPPSLSGRLNEGVRVIIDAGEEVKLAPDHKLYNAAFLLPDGSHAQGRVAGLMEVNGGDFIGEGGALLEIGTGVLMLVIGIIYYSRGGVAIAAVPSSGKPKPIRPSVQTVRLPPRISSALSRAKKHIAAGIPAPVMSANLKPPTNTQPGLFGRLGDVLDKGLDAIAARLAKAPKNVTTQAIDVVSGGVCGGPLAISEGWFGRFLKRLFGTSGRQPEGQPESLRDKLNRANNLRDKDKYEEYKLYIEIVKAGDEVVARRRNHPQDMTEAERQTLSVAVEACWLSSGFFLGPEKVPYLSRAAEMLNMLGRYREALDLCRGLEKLAGVSTQRLIITLYQKGVALEGLGEIRDAAENLKRIAGLFRQTGNYEGMTTAAIEAIKLLEKVSSPAEIIEAYRDLRRDLREVNHTGPLPRICGMEGRKLFEMGDLPGAADAFEEGAGLAEGNNQWDLAGTFWVRTGDISRVANDFERADRAFGKAVDLYRRHGDTAETAKALSSRGEELMRSGRMDEARPVLEEAKALLSGHPELSEYLDGVDLLLSARNPLEAAGAAYKLLDHQKSPLGRLLLQLTRYASLVEGDKTDVAEGVVSEIGAQFREMGPEAANALKRDMLKRIIASAGNEADNIKGGIGAFAYFMKILSSLGDHKTAALAAEMAGDLALNIRDFERAQLSYGGAMGLYISLGDTDGKRRAEEGLKKVEAAKKNNLPH